MDNKTIFYGFDEHLNLSLLLEIVLKYETFVYRVCTIADHRFETRSFCLDRRWRLNNFTTAYVEASVVIMVLLNWFDRGGFAKPFVI